MRILLALLLCPLLAHALPAETWLVAIGNNQGDADELSLLYAERDASQFVETLRRVSGVSPARTITLLGEDADTVRATLSTVAQRLEAAEDAALIVFYSGHADANALHLGGSHLPIDELTAAVRAAPSNLRVLLIDACRSGAASRVKGLRAAEDFEVRIEQPQVEGMVIITSSTAGEDSQESDALRASFFSHHLINGIRGAADRNGDEKVSLSEAYAYTYAQTLRSSGRTMNLQHPTFRFDVKGQGEVVLAHLSSAQRSGRLRLGSAGVYLITDNEGDVAAELAPTRSDAVIALPPKQYLVQERRPREYREYEVGLQSGRTVALRDLPYERIEYDRLVRARGGEAVSVHGLSVLGGARGPVLDGQSVTPTAALGYSADLPWFSLEARLRLAVSSSDGVDDASARRHEEYALGLLAQRFVDLDWASLAFGILLEGQVHRQVFTGDRAIEPRRALGAGYGAVVALERRLYDGLSLRLEGGPLSAVFETVEADGEREVSTPLTWSAALGLKLRL